MKTVYLVSCVKTKLKEGNHQAQNLYISDWFNKAKAYVKQEMKGGDSWFILSAKYELLEPETEISYYEKTLNKMSTKERKDWAANVWKYLEAKLKGVDRVVFLAGANYRKYLLDKIVEKNITINIPMLNLTSGKQLQWLKNNTKGE